MGVKTVLQGLSVSANHSSNAFSNGRAAAAALITEAVVHINDAIILLKEIQKDVPANGDGNLATIAAQITALS
jgi:hypothetical protein